MPGATPPSSTSSRADFFQQRIAGSRQDFHFFLVPSSPRIIVTHMNCSGTPYPHSPRPNQLYQCQIASLRPCGSTQADHRAGDFPAHTHARSLHDGECVGGAANYSLLGKASSYFTYFTDWGWQVNRAIRLYIFVSCFHTCSTR